METCACGKHPKEAPNVVIFIQQILCEFHPRILYIILYIIIRTYIYIYIYIYICMNDMWTDLHCGMCSDGSTNQESTSLSGSDQWRWYKSTESEHHTPVLSQELQLQRFCEAAREILCLSSQSFEDFQGSLRSLLLCRSSNDPCPCSSWTKRYSRPLWNHSKKLFGLCYPMITELVMFHLVAFDLWTHFRLSRKSDK